MRWRVMLLMWMVLVGTAMAQVVVTSSGYATLAGPGITGAPVSAPLVVTPQITFVSHSNSPVGASNATGGNIAGTTNSTIGNIPGVSSASFLVPKYSYGPLGSAGYLQEQYRAGSQAEPQLQPSIQPSEVLFETGAVESDSAYNPMPGDKSMAAVSRQWRQSERVPVRTYTNEDVAQIE